MNSGAMYIAVLLSAAALVSAAGLAAKPIGGAPTTTGLPPAASDAHRGGGSFGGGARNYRPNVPQVGRPFSGRPIPYRMDRDYGDSNTESGRIKQPYPYRYYSDTNRGNVGCYKYAKRAIDTNNRNWWARYQACADGAGN